MIKLTKRIPNLILACIFSISAIVKIFVFYHRKEKSKFITISIIEFIVALFNIGLVIDKNFSPEE